MDGRLTITDVAKHLGVTPRTIMRWEKTGKIKRSKRDWRGWRFYMKSDLDEIKRFYESAYEYNGNGKAVFETAKTTLAIILLVILNLSAALCPSAFAERISSDVPGVIETDSSIDINLLDLPAVQSRVPVTVTEDTKYTLGPDDAIQIDVRRHPEFSGQYSVNSEGKIEYKFVGDVLVTGLTKAELEERLSGILSEYILEPDINVQIIAYLSKVFYVVGEVNRPGKFYMRGNTITIREALVQSGLPNYAAAMRRCRLVTPNDKGANNYVCVNVYELLYGGKLKENLEMKPGDVLYVPSTMVAKFIRIISPVTAAVSEAGGAAARGAGIAAAAL